MKKKNCRTLKIRLDVRTLCYCAVLVALSVLANTYTVYFNVAGSNALAFTYTVDFIAGAFFGPAVGFICGACGDFLGWIVNPSGGGWNPVLTLTSGLLGLIPGLVFWGYKKLFSQKKRYTACFPVATVVSYALVWIFCTNTNTAVMYYFYIYGKSVKYATFLPYYLYRIPWQTAFWAANLALSAALAVPMKKLLKK